MMGWGIEGQQKIKSMSKSKIRKGIMIMIMIRIRIRIKIRALNESKSNCSFLPSSYSQACP